MKILLYYLKNYKGLLALSLALAAINQCFSMLDPWVTGHVVDDVINRHEVMTKQDYIQLALYWIGLSIGVSMVSRIAKNFQDYFVNVITQKLGAQIYADGLKHSLELPFQVFEDQRSGETLGILQKVRVDTEKIISAFISILFTSLVGLIFVTIYSLSISWKVSLVYFASAPIIGIISSYLSKKIKTVQKKIVGETTSLAGSTTESLRNIELIKSLGLAQQEIKRLNKTTYKILGLELNKVKYVRSMSFLQGTTVQLIRSLMVFILLLLIFDDSISRGQYFSFLFYSFFLFGPLQELGNIILVYREAEVSLNNFESLMSKPIEPKPENPVRLEKMTKIQFQHISFQHQSSKNKALNGISFTVNKGETVAFVGPSGSGKSTLVKLLVGLYRPEEGQIFYNNEDSKTISLDALREQIGFVTQDTQLFSGTIKENLLFVKPEATDEELINVLQQASCEKLLQRASDGINTLIGEGGIKVSGGEKQRLSIARALCRKPQLLIFDEATSSLDSITEEEINQTIRNLPERQNQITVLVAHRLSTIMHADRIYVLEQGKIIETGKHEQLLAEKGLYYAMWRQQIGERKN